MMPRREEGVAREIIECISEGREPTVQELFRLAYRVQRDLGMEVSAFSWGQLNQDSSMRLISLKLAQAALRGEGLGR